MQQEKKVLFVCLGNICRSPLAEGILRKKVEDMGLQEFIKVDSCGTSGYHTGERPDYRARKVAQSRGVELRNQARKIASNDFKKYDLIIAMDTQNLFEIQRLAKPEQKGKIKLMMEFSGQFPAERNVFDPYYDGEEKFEEVYNLLDSCVSNLLNYLLKA